MSTVPLIEAQSGLWYAQCLATEKAAFNTAHALWMEGPLNIAAFRQAADQAVAEADALALRIFEETTGPVQAVEESWRPWLEVVDLSAQPDPEQAARAIMFSERMTPLDPVKSPLAKQCLFQLGNDRFVWYLRVHHLATDGYGMALLTERVCTLYAAALAAKDKTAKENTGNADAGTRLAPLAPVFEDDQAYRVSERREKEARYWRERSTNMPAATGLGAGFAPAAGDCLRLIWPIEAAFQERLHQVSAEIGQPWPDVLTALTAAYCQRMAGVSTAVVGVPFMGRLGQVSARVPMMIMNVLPLCVAESAEKTVTEFVKEVSRDLVRGRRHGRYRGEQLRRDLGLLGGQRRLHGPLINVQPFYRPPQLDGVTAQLEILATGPVDDVTLGFRGDARSTFDLEIEANPALYTQTQVTAHAERLLSFLSAAFDVQQHGGTMNDIPLATSAEAQRYLYEVNATDHEVPDTTLVDLYEARMKATPEAPALEFEGEVLSYAQLEQRTRALALQLRERGVQREAMVAVALPRSLELVIALLAVQRAGGAYLPLDLAHPDHRLLKILQSARPVCVLAEPQEAARFPAEFPVLSPDRWEQQSTAALDNNVQPEDAAYVIYTSGSTGEPKGVLIEHRAIVNRLEWMRTHYQFDSRDRILQKTPATFDVSVWEFFLAFLSSGTLVVAPPEAHRDPVALARLIRDRAISTLHFVPSMLSAFLAAPESQGLTLRRVFCSGEELAAEQRDLFHQRIQSELHNLYGPTEAAVDVSYWPAAKTDRSRPVPIGFPVWNTRLYVLDSQMRPVPPGVAGDLYLGGVQLARGYLGQPELTAQRFLEDPFLPGERIYQTGDLAMWREEGAVVFLGRSDHQVKLRGLRIELGEIEAALLTRPEVRRAEVIVREDRPGDRRLVAYVQTQSPFDAHALRTAVAANVPDYMVPSAIMELQNWPVTTNGKLDRNALPAPQTEIGQQVPLQTATEKLLAKLFTEALGLQGKIGADADFFALGGDSLSAVHLLLAIQKQWQRDPGLGALFNSPTVAGLAAVLDAVQDAENATPDHGLGPLIRLSEGASSLSPLFVVHPAGGIAWNYRELARGLKPGRTVYGLQSPALDESQPVPESIDDLAADYVDRVLNLHPQGPVHLLGWSVGGIIAQAMAVRLKTLGREVGLLTLLDAYPSDCWRDQPEPDPIAALRALLAIAGYDPERHTELDSREKILAFLRQGDSALGNLPDPVLDGVVRAVTGTNRLVRLHHHARFSGTLLHLRAGRDHSENPQLQSALWTAYADQVEALELPFLHAELTGRAASAQIAPLLDERLQHWDHSTGNHSTGVES